VDFAAVNGLYPISLFDFLFLALCQTVIVTFNVLKVNFKMACLGCNVPLREFSALTLSRNSLMQFLYAHNVLISTLRCERCGGECRVDWKRNLFRCDRQVTESLYGGRKKRVTRCNYQKSIVAGSWFAGQKLGLDIICYLTYLWLVIPHPRHRFIMQQVHVSHHTVVDWASFCREVCVYWLQQRSEVLGGPGVVVEIDEAKIGHRKYNRGRLVDGKWVFGGFERGSKRCFIVPVPSRDAQTLLSVIRDWIAPGTTIMSDCWRAYDCLGSEGFVHQTVNHSQNFVDPNTGAHTQNIERLWRDVRGGIPRFGGRKHHLVGYLAEFMFKRKFSDPNSRAHAFFCAAGQLYPPAPDV
jgi:transposase-like protein